MEILLPINPSAFFPQSNVCMAEQEHIRDMITNTKKSMDFLNAHKSKAKPSIACISTMTSNFDFSSLCINMGLHHHGHHYSWQVDNFPGRVPSFGQHKLLLVQYMKHFIFVTFVEYANLLGKKLFLSLYCSFSNVRIIPVLCDKQRSYPLL